MQNFVYQIVTLYWRLTDCALFFKPLTLDIAFWFQIMLLLTLYHIEKIRTFRFWSCYNFTDDMFFMHLINLTVNYLFIKHEVSINYFTEI